MQYEISAQTHGYTPTSTYYLCVQSRKEAVEYCLPEKKEGRAKDAKKGREEIKEWVTEEEVR